MVLLKMCLKSVWRKWVNFSIRATARLSNNCARMLFWCVVLVVVCLKVCLKVENFEMDLKLCLCFL